MEEWLNKKIRYTVTGFEGICTAVAKYNTGCVKLLLEGNDTTGRPIEWWIDETKAERSGKK